jgi:hypothetical protein
MRQTGLVAFREPSAPWPIELPGGHSPMLADPKQLADVLVQLAR